jgi:hypothetical protein
MFFVRVLCYHVLIIKIEFFENLESACYCFRHYHELIVVYIVIHCSGQAAVITPRQVTTGLGSRRVMAIAAAKHHTVIATQGGEVFTWGSNRGKICRYLTILMFIMSLVLKSVTVNYFTRCNRVIFFPISLRGFIV